MQSEPSGQAFVLPTRTPQIQKKDISIFELKRVGKRWERNNNLL